MARWWFFYLVALCACTARGGDLSGRLRVQAGQEYDTNAPRRYGANTPSDFLARLIWQGELSYGSGPHLLGLDYLGGAKIFYQTTGNNQVATQINAVYRNRLPRRRSTGLRLVLKDATQAKHNLDYRLIRGEAFLRMRLAAPLTLETWAGGRDFLFKPDREEDSLKYSNLGPDLGLRVHADLGHSWSTWLTYLFDVRFYNCQALTGEETHPQDEVKDRQDLRHVAAVGVRFQTNWWKRHRLIVRTSYVLSYNDSSSDGSSVVWHRLRAVLSMQFPLDLTLHLMGTLQFSDYLDGRYLDYDFYEPDADENENSVVVRLTYRLWQELSLLLQAAVYRNEFHSSSIEQLFERETITLGVSWDWSFQ